MHRSKVLAILTALQPVTTAVLGSVVPASFTPSLSNVCRPAIAGSGDQRNSLRRSRCRSGHFPPFLNVFHNNEEFDVVALSSQHLIPTRRKTKKNTSDDNNMKKPSLAQESSLLFSSKNSNGRRGMLLGVSSFFPLVFGYHSPCHATKDQQPEEQEEEEEEEEDPFAAFGKSLKSSGSNPAKGTTRGGINYGNEYAEWPSSPSPLPTRTKSARELTGIPDNNDGGGGGGSAVGGSSSSTTQTLEQAMKDAAKRRQIEPRTHG